jgi:hypothetical protein
LLHHVVCWKYQLGFLTLAYDKHTSLRDSLLTSREQTPPVVVNPVACCVVVYQASAPWSPAQLPRPLKPSPRQPSAFTQVAKDSTPPPTSNHSGKVAEEEDAADHASTAIHNTLLVPPSCSPGADYTDAVDMLLSNHSRLSVMLLGP